MAIRLFSQIILAIYSQEPFYLKIAYRALFIETLNHLNCLYDQDSDGNTMDNPMLALIETLAVTWFTLEYLLRSWQTTIIRNASKQVCWGAGEMEIPQRWNEHY